MKAFEAPNSSANLLFMVWGEWLLQSPWLGFVIILTAPLMQNKYLKNFKLLELQINKDSASFARITQLGFKILQVNLMGEQKSKGSESKSSTGLYFQTRMTQDPHL